jgi:hypothetical protein
MYLPVPVLRKDGSLSGDHASSGHPPELLPAWQAYHAVIADWRTGKFEEKFPQQPYRHSLAEESDALIAAARILQTLKQDEKTAGLVTGDTV